MGRDIRYLPPEDTDDTLAELTVRTIQQRYLLRPGPRLNQLVVGVLAHAQTATAMCVHGVVAMSSHIHLLVSPTTVEQMAEFMCLVNANLAKEAGRLHAWPGTMFPRRYASIPISNEPQAQIARLRYLMSQGTKENLVMAPTDWPGVHSSRAMIEGRAMKGIWIKRREMYYARQRGKDVLESDFTVDVELELDPLPCWRHLEAKAYRARVQEIADDIERATIARHKRDETVPKGAEWVRRRHPHERPKPGHRSPRPRFHAFAKKIRAQMVAAYREFLAAYRVAAERLAEGVLSVAFPEDCFPPPLPFVKPLRLEPG